ncbi:MAG: tyrosine-type recombinase/integrase, partial [Candidatus Nanopelagicales bacterium]
MPSGRFEARFTWQGKAYSKTWDTRDQGEKWMQRTRRELANGTYAGQQLEDPDTGKPLAPTFAEYSVRWLAERDLKPRTRSEYRRMLPHMKPLDSYRLDQITRTQIADWHRGIKAPPTHKAHVYSLCRAILNSATSQGLIDANPCLIERAGRVRRRSRTEVPSPVQVHQLADAMPSAKYSTLVLVAAWCGLRFGEATELRRHDVVMIEGEPVRLRVRRGVVRVDKQVIVGDPKSEAGVRDVVIPPHVRGALGDYLASLPSKPDALLFPGTRSGSHMAPSSLYRPFYRAREAVGLPTLRWHDLRHFSGTVAAQTGATLAELQARLGHSTVQAAMRYQHAAAGRDAKIAEAMSN